MNYQQILANAMALGGGALPAGVTPPQAVAQQLQDAPAPTDGVTDTTALLPSSPGTEDQVQPQTDNGLRPGFQPTQGWAGNLVDALTPSGPAPVRAPIEGMSPKMLDMAPAQAANVEQGVPPGGQPDVPAAPLPPPPAPVPAPAAPPPPPPAAAPTPAPPVHAGGGGGPAVPANITPQSAANDVENARVAGQDQVDKGAALQAIQNQALRESNQAVDPEIIARAQRDLKRNEEISTAAKNQADMSAAAADHFNQDHYQADHFYQTRTGIQKFEIAASMILGTIGAGSTGVNAGVQVFNENRARDLELQKLQFAHDKDAVGAYADAVRSQQAAGLTLEQANRAATIMFGDQQNAIMRTKLFRADPTGAALTAFDTAKQQVAHYVNQAGLKKEQAKSFWDNTKAAAEATQAYGAAGLARAEAEKTGVETTGLRQQQEITKEALGGQLGGGGGTNEAGQPVPNGAQRAVFQNMGYDVPVGIPGVAPSIGGRWNLQPKAVVEQATAASRPIEEAQSMLQEAHDIRSRNSGAPYMGADLTRMRLIEARLPQLMDSLGGSGAISNRNFGIYKNIAGNINASRIWPGDVQAGIESLWNSLEEERLQKLAPLNPQRQAMRAKPVE